MEEFDISLDLEPVDRTGQLIRVILFFDNNDPFFKDKLGVGLQYFGVEGREGEEGDLNTTKIKIKIFNSM